MHFLNSISPSCCHGACCVLWHKCCRIYLVFTSETKGFLSLLLLSITLMTGSFFAILSLFDLLHWVARTWTWLLFQAHAVDYLSNTCYATASYIIVAILIDRCICYNDPMYYIVWRRSSMRIAIYVSTGVIRWHQRLLAVVHSKPFTTSLMFNVCKNLTAVLQYLLPMVAMITPLRKIH